MKAICPHCKKEINMVTIDGNKTRDKILKILKEYQPINILGISKIIGIGYKSTWNHIQYLRKMKKVKVTNITITNKGRNRFVMLNK